MNLLMITGLGSAKDLASGGQGAFYNTLEEFHKYWDRIDIISPQIANPDKYVEQPFDNVHVHMLRVPFSLWNFISGTYKRHFLKKAVEIHRKEGFRGFDLITVQDYPPFYNGIWARILWKKINTPYISEIHHIPGYPKVARSNPKETVREWLYSRPLLWIFWWKKFGSKAKTVRVVNQKQTPGFLKKVGVPENKITYIPSMYIDFDIFKPVGLQKKYDLIFVGRLDANKGVNLLLNAVKILNIKYKIQNIKVLIVGGGSESEREKVRRPWNVYSSLIDHGRAKNSQEIAELMNKSKVLVMPSYNEGGPRVVLEAMACGVPVLATNVGLMPDFANKNAVKIIDWKAEDIANKAKELLENESERNRLSQAGMEIAKQFEKKEMIKNYADKLKELI